MSGNNSKIIRLKNISLIIRKDNYIEGYDRYSHTKEYIELKYRTCGKDDYALIKESNFQYDPHGFEEYRKLWHNLELGLPLDYLTAIGGTISGIEKAVNQDEETYNEILKHLIPVSYIERVIPGIYTSHVFPKGLSEEDAIEYVKKKAVSNRYHRFAINFPQIKCTYFEPDGSYSTEYFSVRFAINDYPTARAIIFGIRDGSRIGTTIIA